MKIKNKSVFLLVLLGLSLMLVACGAEQTAVSNDAYQLIIYEGDLFSLKLTEEAEDAFPLIDQLEESDQIAVMGLQDIEIVDWELQTMTLTEDGTSRLETAVSEHPHLSEEARMLSSIKQSTGRSTRLESGLVFRPFEVRFEDDVIYRGVFLDTSSAQSVDYPVIRVTESDAKAVLHVLPGHFQNAMNDPVDEAGEMREALFFQDPNLELDDFEVKIISVSAMTEDAIQFRLLIRDEQLKMLFEMEGKLQ